MCEETGPRGLDILLLVLTIDAFTFLSTAMEYTDFDESESNHVSASTSQVAPAALADPSRQVALGTTSDSASMPYSDHFLDFLDYASLDSGPGVQQGLIQTWTSIVAPDSQYSFDYLSPSTAFLPYTTSISPTISPTPLLASGPVSTLFPSTPVPWARIISPEEQALQAPNDDVIEIVHRTKLSGYEGKSTNIISSLPA
jgi:hypothetical protein